MKPIYLTRTVLVVGLIACSSAGGPGGGPEEPGDPSPAGDWDCASTDDVTQCERAGGGEHENYTCSSGDADCPPAGAADGDAWACIVEETETQCREVVANEAMASMRPTDCEVASWKVYFCQLADVELASRGIPYTMRCDELADQLELRPLPSTACNEVVDQLELESWTEATYAGCAGQLSQAITAWCYNTNLQLSGAEVCD